MGNCCCPEENANSIVTSTPSPSRTAGLGSGSSSSTGVNLFKQRLWSNSTSRLRERNIDEPDWLPEFDWTIGSEWLKSGFPERNFWFKSVNCHLKGQIYRRVVFTQEVSNTPSVINSPTSPSALSAFGASASNGVDIDRKQELFSTIPINTSFSYLVRLSSGDFLLLDDQFMPAYACLISPYDTWIVLDHHKIVPWQLELFLDLMKKGMADYQVASTRKAIYSGIGTARNINSSTSSSTDDYNGSPTSAAILKSASSSSLDTMSSMLLTTSPASHYQLQQMQFMESYQNPV